jgi:hypothetical protein
MSIERSVAKLEAQQEAMAQDVSEMKSALTSIARTLQDLSSMEQRQVHLTETVTRAHKRIDEIQAIVKDEVKNHEKRIQTNGLSASSWLASWLLLVCGSKAASNA